MIYAPHDTTMNSTTTTTTAATFWHRHDQQPIAKAASTEQEHWTRLGLSASSGSPWRLDDDNLVGDNNENKLLLSPIGSGLCSLPLQEYSFQQSHQPDMVPFAFNIPEAMSPHQVDTALLGPEVFAQLWRQLVEESKLLGNDLFGDGDDQFPQLDAEPEQTPPLAFDLDVPLGGIPVPDFEPCASVSASANVPPPVELVAPKPRRLVNPAIHLAALVEEEDNAVATGPFVPVEEADELEEYMSDSEQSFDGSEGLEEEGNSNSPLVTFPSSFMFSPHVMPSFVDPVKLDDWSFPSTTSVHEHALPSFQLSPLEPLLTPEWHPRTTQLREAMRQQRAARLQGYSHARHTSLPDVQYRPPRWNNPAHSDDLQSSWAPPIRRRHAQMSQSVDWSSQNMIQLPSLNEPAYQTTSQYPTNLPYHPHFLYGGQ